MKKTPLYDLHRQYGGRIIDFGGWALPVQYSDILEEHHKVRTAAGLFDVSHMGEITVKGPGAAAFVQKMVTNDILKAEDFQVVYSPMCYPDGGVVDDLLIYRFNKEEYLLVVNGVNTDKDFQWLREHAHDQVEIKNVSSEYAQLSLQGPKAEHVLQKLTDMALAEIKFFRFKPQVDIGGIKALVSRTGYTGEDGFEIYASSEDASVLWEKIMEAGRDAGLVPAGLGARDTLRFEAALPLYGQEISRDISPLEARLGWTVKLDKEDFIGKAALTAQKAQGLRRTLVGFEMIDRGVPRSHYKIEKEGEEIGFVTTGNFSPSLNKNIGMAFVNSVYAAEGMEIDIVIRKKALKARVIGLPFYRKRYRK